MKSISEYTSLVEEALKALSFPTGKFANLYEPISYALSAGGKRIRPVMTLMACDAFAGNYESALKAALGIEMFHNFTLLHDDVMDNSDMRRGRLTVYKKYNTNSAILSGDTMLTLATEYITEVKDEKLRTVIDTFNDMAIKVYEGQQLDMDFENAESINIEDYIEMIEYKTGALLGAAMKIGSLIGNASAEDADLMKEFGLMTGVAFQIRDDWLDSFGDPTTFGKKIGGDINNAKKTFLYVSALAEGGEGAKALKAAFEIPAGDVRIKTVTRIYEKLGMKEKCSKAVGHYSSKALKALNATSLSEEKKEVFKNLAEKLIGRKK